RYWWWCRSRPRPTRWCSRAPLATIPAQLPHDVPGFTGRTAELRRIGDVVSGAQSRGEASVVVVTGGPGVGKTALAIHFAHRIARQFPDGQLYLDLQGYAPHGRPTPPHEALGSLLAAFRIRTEPPDGTLERSALFRSHVAGRRLLVVLDNAASVEQVRPLLPGGSSSVVLVTGRTALTGLAVRDGARRIGLDVLQEEEAISLFSRAVGHTFTAAQYPAVRKIVDACARLPLALRIAAARMHGTAPPNVAIAALAALGEEHLFDYLHVPGDERATLRCVFDWSLRELPPDAAQLLQALGLARESTFTLDDAAELSGADRRTVRRSLDTLVEASLVDEPMPDHFRLHGLLLAYARRLLDAGLV
ncbi:AAA family ATPase, partial [Dactylosporangium sp. NPDC005572]|uniref:AAA family ATPase n=1 Tax=Dactylosporangium sp. NPDC005572 TaxID=3156889 RepID=UPI0033ABB9FF